MRFQLAVWLLLAALAAGPGCATRDPATLAAEQEAAEADEDAMCQRKGTPDSEAYEACRKQLADARARAAAIEEERRRDFDRTLGAGTDGLSNY